MVGFKSFFLPIFSRARVVKRVEKKERKMQLHFYLLHMNSAYRLRTRVNLYVSGNPKNVRSAYCALDICSKHRSYCLMNMNSCIRTDIDLHTIEKITSKHDNIVEFTFLQIVTFPLLRSGINI